MSSQTSALLVFHSASEKAMTTNLQLWLSLCGGAASLPLQGLLTHFRPSSWVSLCHLSSQERNLCQIDRRPLKEVFLRSDNPFCQFYCKILSLPELKLVSCWTIFTYWRCPYLTIESRASVHPLIRYFPAFLCNISVIFYIVVDHWKYTYVKKVSWFSACMITPSTNW